MSAGSNRPFLLGGAQTDFAKNWSKGGGAVEPVLESALSRAFEDVQLDDDELVRRVADGRVGVFVGNFDAHQYLGQGHLGAFVASVRPSLEGAFAARYEAACASGGIAIDAAASKLVAGEIDLAIVVGIELMRGVDSVTSNAYLASASHVNDEAAGVDYFFPQLFGKLTNWVLERSPELDERRLLGALDQISRTNTDNAKKNPNAQTRSWDFQSELFQQREAEFAARLGGRTRLRDCSQLTDGAAVVVLATPTVARDHAARRGWKGRLSRLAGRAVTTSTVRFAPKLARAKRVAELFPDLRRATRLAHERAEVPLGKVDVIELHDCFTISEYVMLGALGLTEPGREHEAVESGVITAAGKTPVNPSGGLIGGGHPVGASGVRMALDVHRQVTGRAGDLQVDGAHSGAFLNIGGSFTTTVCGVLTKDDA